MDANQINQNAEAVERENVFLGIKLKKNATYVNLFSIFYVFFIMTTIGGYVNVQIVYLLRDTGYFDVNQDHIGRITSNILLTALIVGALWGTVAGTIYDIFSRKMPIFFAGIMGAFLLFLCPHSAPSIVWLTLIRACIQMCMSTMLSHPLIMDYVKKDSRGKAAAI